MNTEQKPVLMYCGSRRGRQGKACLQDQNKTCFEKGKGSADEVISTSKVDKKHKKANKISIKHIIHESTFL